MKVFGAIVGAILAIAIILWALLFFLPPNIKTTTSKPSTLVSTIILPHHDLVKIQRQQFLADIKKSAGDSKTIILLSPNHYESGSSDVQTTNQTWEISSGKIYTDSIATTVYFKTLTPEQINAYVATGYSLDKAGGYGIQEKESNFVERIDGDYWNVVGLPIDAVVKALRKFGVKIV